MDAGLSAMPVAGRFAVVRGGGSGATRLLSADARSTCGRRGGKGAVMGLALSGEAGAGVVAGSGAAGPGSAAGGGVVPLPPNRLAIRLPMDGPPPREACVERPAFRDRTSALATS
jgi:hypothetical protein